MKKSDPKLALLRAYIKTRPTGINARVAMLALALHRGMPHLAVEPEPLKWRDGIVVGPRKSYPNLDIPEHRLLLATCVSVTSQEIGNLPVTPEAALAWLNAGHTDATRAQAIATLNYMGARHEKKKEAHQKAKLLWKATKSLAYGRSVSEEFVNNQRFAFPIGSADRKEDDGAKEGAT